MSDAPDLPRIWVNLDDCDMDYRPFEGGIEYIRADVAEKWRSLLARIHTASFPGTRAEGDDLDAALEEAGEVLSNE